MGAFYKGVGDCSFCKRKNIKMVNRGDIDICNWCYIRKCKGKPIGEGYAPKVQYERTGKKVIKSSIVKIAASKPSETGKTHSVSLDSFNMNLDEVTIRSLIIEYVQICPMSELEEITRSALKYKLSKVTVNSLFKEVVNVPVEREKKQRIPRHPSNYKEWTPAEDAKVLREYMGYELKEKYTKKERVKLNKALAKTMGRTKAAVSWRYYFLKNGRMGDRTQRPIEQESEHAPA